MWTADDRHHLETFRGILEDLGFKGSLMKALMYGP